MMDILTGIATLLILIFTAVTVWHQVIRTPRASIRVTLASNEKSYTPSSKRITFNGNRISVSNEGEMDAEIRIDSDFDILVNNEPYQIPTDAEIEVRSPKFGRIQPGKTIRQNSSIKTHFLDELPSHFTIEIEHTFKIKDNTGSKSQTAYEKIDVENQFSTT